MKTYYVLSGNQVLGHFDTLRESWTLEEAVEMAAIDTTQEALERFYMEGAPCVHHDDETDCYVFDVYGCRVLDFEPDAGVLELCELVRLNKEWLNATGEEFKYELSVAAKELGGVIV